MNYNLLEQLGLDNFDLTYLFVVSYCLILILMILIMVQTVRLNKLSKKYSKFMSGKTAKSLEKEIMGLYEDNKFVKTSVEKNRKDIQNLYRKLESAYQKVGIVKYDAFKEIGGTLSFVLVMLTKDNDGFILNSMHSNSEGCYTYIKEVKSGEVFVALSEEERQALEEAKES